MAEGGLYRHRVLGIGATGLVRNTGALRALMDARGACFRLPRNETREQLSRKAKARYSPCEFFFFSFFQGFFLSNLARGVFCTLYLARISFEKRFSFGLIGIKFVQNKKTTN